MLDLDAPRLPLRRRKALSCGRTSLGDNPAFPPDGDNRFDAEVASEMFKEALDGYNALDMPSKSLEPGDLERTLDKWTARCRELERPLRPRLEDICGNAVSAALAGWGNLVELKAGLVDEVDLPPARLTPEKSSFEDLDGMERVEELNGEVYKRRFLDALVASWTSGPFLFWTFLAAMTLGLCYAALYRGYSLLGVGRTLSMTAFYVPVEIVAMLALMGVIPSYFLVIGVILSVAGMFVMYWESDSIKDKMRDNSSVNQGNGGI